MNLFESVKDGVTTRAAAEAYGIQVHRNGMCCCPFHPDKNPSMKVDKRFHCFGCQADGDVIDFTARLFNLPKKEAALKLSADFGIGYDDRPAPIKPKKREPTEAEIFEKRYAACFQELLEVRNRYLRWQEIYAPKTRDETWNPRFEEAANRLPEVEYKLDLLLSNDRDAKLLVMREQEEKEEEKLESVVKTPVYHETAAYAREHNELDQYRNSHWANIACRHDIEDVIARNFDGMHLNHECAKDVLDRFGSERVQLVLAATVQQKAWEGRFSWDNKEWAHSVTVPGAPDANGYDHRCEYVVNTHPTVLNGFISLMRKTLKEQERPSIKEALKTTHVRRESPHPCREAER